MSHSLRSHQRQVDQIMQAIAAKETEVRDMLAAVTPGGGKSLLPVIAASRLIKAGSVERVVWVVPRETLKRQAEEAFADGAWRNVLGHALSVRAAENGLDPSRGLAGYVTTYQAVAAAPDLHLAEFQRYRTLLVIDELHHLPALDGLEAGNNDDEAAWSRALLPLLETSAVRLLMSGTLTRSDGRPILWLPYQALASASRGREIVLDAPGWAVIGYSRRTALLEQAILPCVFGAVDGEAEWLDADQSVCGPHRLSASPETTRPALFTALRPGLPSSCFARPSAPAGSIATAAEGRSALLPTRTRWAWGSCWSLPQTRPWRGATMPACVTGSPQGRPGARCALQ